LGIHPETVHMSLFTVTKLTSG